MRVQNPLPPSHRDVEMSRRHHVVTFGVFDSNVMSSHITSSHVMSQHRNVAMFWIRMNNVAMFLANIVTLLEIYEQRHDVGHERRDVAGFSNDKKVAKIQSLGLLHTLTILDHLMTIYNNNTRSKYFHTKNLIFENFEKHRYQNRKLSTINRF